MPRIVAIVLAILWSVNPASAVDLDTLLTKVDEVRAPTDFSVDVKVVGPKGQELEMSVRVRGGDKSLVLYTAPSNSVGRSLLFVESNMWIYVPGTRRPIRISPNQQILGGVSSADIARTVFDGDYEAVAAAGVAQDSRIKAPDGAKLEEITLQPRHRKATYGKINLVVDQNANPYRAVFYSLSGRALKTAYFTQYTSVLGRRRPMGLDIYDHIQGDELTTIRYSGMQTSQTPASWFQPSYMQRLK